MKKLGLKPGDTKLIYRAPGGMYYRKTDSDSLKEMMARFDREKEAAIVGDTTGEGFILDMFSTELANHEFGYTYELEEGKSKSAQRPAESPEEVRGDHLRG